MVDHRAVTHEVFTVYRQQSFGHAAVTSRRACWASLPRNGRVIMPPTSWTHNVNTAQHRLVTRAETVPA